MSDRFDDVESKIQNVSEDIDGLKSKIKDISEKLNIIDVQDNERMKEHKDNYSEIKNSVDEIAKVFRKLNRHLIRFQNLMTVCSIWKIHNLIQKIQFQNLNRVL